MEQITMRVCATCIHYNPMGGRCHCPGPRQGTKQSPARSECYQWQGAGQCPPMTDFG